MICPYLVNLSVLLGGIISWGIMWPIIEHKKGDWYPADLKPSSLRGIVGYRVRTHPYLVKISSSLHRSKDSISM